jgi:hypothetical protein
MDSSNFVKEINFLGLEDNVGKHGVQSMTALSFLLREFVSISEVNCVFYFLFFIFIHLFTRAYILWDISPPYLLPSPSPIHPPLLPCRICSALISNFVEEKT